MPLKYVIGEKLATGLRRVLELLPVSFVLKLGELGGRIAYRYQPRERAISEAQIAFVKSKGYLPNAPDPETLTKAVFRHAGLFGAEAMILRKLMTRTPDGRFVYIENDDNGITPELAKEKNGVFAISGHIGSFELLCAHYTHWGLEVTAVGRELNFDFPKYLLERYREEYGANTIWRADMMGVRRIVDAYKKGTTVTSLIDQDTALPSRYANFFGLPAGHPNGPIRLAVNKKARIVSAFIVRTAPQKHVCITRDIPYDPADPDAEQKVLDVFSQRLQDLVTEYPEQWIWWHRRWRRKAGVDYDANPDELLSTKQYIQWLKSQTAEA